MIEKHFLNNQAVSLFTIRDWIRWVASLFSEAPLTYGHGTDNPWDEAVSLVLNALNAYDFPVEYIWDARLTEDEKSELIHLIEQRINAHIPVPYLTHQALFTDLSFYVDERVLIPRSPIGELIETQFEPWLERERLTRILDLCCGSGCIAISMAVYFDDPSLQIDAIDISEDALNVARMNVEKHEVGEQVTLIQSDLFTAIPAERYDLIVCNPPYVDQAEMATLPDEYRHEPELALASGNEGLDFVHRLLNQAKAHLMPKGVLIVEVGASAPALIAAYPNLPFIWLEFERGGDGVFLLHAEDIPAGMRH